MSDLTDATGASLFEDLKSVTKEKETETMSLETYFDLCKRDSEAVKSGELKYPMAYATVSERLLEALGEGEKINTAEDTGKLKNKFAGEVIVRYPAFSNLYGMENVLKKVVEHIESAAEGGQFKKKMMLLMGPPGGGKNTIVNQLKKLLEQNPIYVLKAKDGDLSPNFDSPLSLFQDDAQKNFVAEKYGIPKRYLNLELSPWAQKRLDEAGGEFDKAFEVVKTYPSLPRQIAFSHLMAGDVMTQDISQLVGKTDLSAMGDELPQDDIDTYQHSGALQKGNQGIFEFEEAQKASGDMQKPLIQALESQSYTAAENVGNMPFYGAVIAHTNEAEWKEYLKKDTNEAMLDRTNQIDVPYVMSYDDEAKIYQKEIDRTGLSKYPIAPGTKEILAQWSTMTRLEDGTVLDKFSPLNRVKVLNGEKPPESATEVPDMKTIKDETSLRQGMEGSSTRFAFGVLAKTFNAKAIEGYREADPVLIMDTLKDAIMEEKRFSDEQKEKYKGYLNMLKDDYKERVEEIFIDAFTDASDEMCQNMFDRYIALADAWIEGDDFNDKGFSGEMLDKQQLDQKLKEMEGPAGIGNPESFRNEVTRYVFRQERKGEKVKWNSYEPLANVIRQKLRVKFEDIKPLLSFDTAKTDKEKKKQSDFIKRLEKKGYTRTMVQRHAAMIG
ncbi:MAG: PrkA family serine protein kinase [Alphaproteobacteria bacterium]|nr:PrkA family serine protein kinase [Alphaproteobacteria bacterium]